ncbi:VWA domain-containing protein [Campylobacter lari]|nr:VWA domain-containing protein [Campylobacter lari]MCW0231115.1 VWA domain-containing protein [Campylobacter lari]
MSNLNENINFSIIQPRKTAVLVDLSFFIERYNTLNISKI